MTMQVGWNKGIKHLKSEALLFMTPLVTGKKSLRFFKYIPSRGRSM